MAVRRVIAGGRPPKRAGWGGREAGVKRRAGLSQPHSSNPPVTLPHHFHGSDPQRGPRAVPRIAPVASLFAGCIESESITSFGAIFKAWCGGADSCRPQGAPTSPGERLACAGPPTQELAHTGPMRANFGQKVVGFAPKLAGHRCCQRIYVGDRCSLQGATRRSRFFGLFRRPEDTHIGLLLSCAMLGEAYVRRASMCGIRASSGPDSAK